jgi:hypothetical protein
MRLSLGLDGEADQISARTCQMKEMCFIGEYDQIADGELAHVLETSGVGDGWHGR